MSIQNRYIAVVVALLLGVATLHAQSIDSRRELIRKMEHPTLSQGSEYLIFDSCNYSLGVISEDDESAKGSFTLCNTGEEVIVITKATTSCNCVTVSYPKGPIATGESATVDFRYSPKGYPGAINRRILLYTSLSNSIPSALLTLSGEVTPSKNLSGSYPYALGQLKMRQGGVTFANTTTHQVERILCINDGESPLRLGTINGQLPAGISFRCEPEVIAQGEEADIVISFDPTKWKGEGDNYPIIIDGLNVAPSKRAIYVKFGNKN